jgi:hypothetical protein
MERNKSIKTAVAACVLSLTLSAASPARTRYVSEADPADFRTIQAAIDDANDGDTIIIQPGTYTGPGNRDISFRGKAITVRGVDPNDPNAVESTIVDCNAQWGDLHRGFAFTSGEGPGSRLEGVVVQNGCSDGGGAILCIRSSPIISKCLIRGNYSGSTSLRPQLDPNLPAEAAWNGGGINACENASPTIVDCVLEHNHARSGGGIYLSGSSGITIMRCKVKDNDATAGGGGIYCGGYGHQAGGAIQDCVVASNRAAEGGGMLCSRNQPLIANCLITHNLATTEPIGLDSRSGGGAIMCFQSNPTILNCTIVGNHANASGGGINCPSGWGKVVLENCIIWGNSATYGNQLATLCGRCVVGSQEIELWYCCIEMNSNALFAEQDNEWETGNAWTIDLAAQHSIDTDPGFVSSGHWDLGETPHDPYDDVWVGGDCHLQSQAGRWEPGGGSWVVDEVTSPCIDAGDPNSPVGDEPQPNGGRVNMGAYGGTGEASKSYTSP